MLAPGGRAAWLLLLLWQMQCGAPDHEGGKYALVSGEASDGLVFVQARAGGSEVLRARLADAALRTVTHTPKREEMWPVWSEAAGLLVIETRRAGLGGGHRLVVLDPASGRERPLTSSRASHEAWATWAPAGNRVAFSFSLRLGELRMAGLATATASAGTRHVLSWTPFAERFLRPAWAASGDHLVVQRHRPGTPFTDLWVLPLEGSPRSLVVDAQWHDVKPRYTRDGAWVVFTRRPSVEGPGDVVRVRPDGSDLEVIASLPDSDDHTATPSPARDEIAFVSDRDGSADVFLADLDGGSVRNLTRSPDVDETTPHWAPDGERLAVAATPRNAASPSPARHSTRNEALRASFEGARIAVIDREGRHLFEVPGYSPDWMPPWR